MPRLDHRWRPSMATPEPAANQRTASGRRADAERNRAAIIAATQALFAETNDVPMYEIGRRAGVGQATLYRHFPTRDSLLLAVCSIEVDQLEAVADMQPDSPDTLWQLIEAMVRSQVRFRGMVDRLAVEPGSDPDSDAIQQRVFALLGAPLRAAVEGATVRADLTVDDVLLLMTMVDGALRQPLARRTPDATVERLLQLIRGGIAAPPAP